MARTVVGLYSDIHLARAALQDLVDSGFDRGDISLIAGDSSRRYARELNLDYSQAGESPIGPEDIVDMDEEEGSGESAAKGAGIGAALGGLAGLLLGLGALMIPGIGPVLAAGPLVAALGGAGVGAVTGGMIGALSDAGISEDDARRYQEGIRRGGTLLVVSAEDEAADLAAAIINRHHPVALGEQEGILPTGGAPTGKTSEAEKRGKDWGFNESGHESVFDGEGPPYHEREPRSPLDYGLGARTYLPGKAVADYDRSQADPSRELKTHSLDWRTYESRFKHHFETHYARTGKEWVDYREAYRFGFETAQEPGYSNQAWPVVSEYVRQRWETRHMGRSWEEFEGAIRDGWEVGHVP